MVDEHAGHTGQVACRCDASDPGCDGRLHTAIQIIVKPVAYRSIPERAVTKP